MIAEYMTWKAIKPLVVASIPWLVVLTVVGGLVWFGYNKGADKWKSQYDYALEQRDRERAEVARVANELAIVKDAKARQDQAIRNMEEEHAAQLERRDAAHDAALRRQADAHRRAELERDREAESLRERMRLMTAAEACHEAWLEVMR